jgi:hypothetical protein
MAWIKSLVQRPSLVPLPDQQPPPLVVVLLDGDGLGPLAIRRFDRAEIFAFAAHDDDAPASQIGGLFGICTPGHTGKMITAEREDESVCSAASRTPPTAH